MQRSIFIVLLAVLAACSAFTFHPRVSGLRSTQLFGKKDKYKAKNAQARNAPSKSETQGRADRFDAMTRQFMVRHLHGM